jgi:hypothetical protein
MSAMAVDQIQSGMAYSAPQDWMSRLSVITLVSLTDQGEKSSDLSRPFIGKDGLDQKEINVCSIFIWSDSFSNVHSYYE